MNYSYTNNTDTTVIFRNDIWLPGQSLDTPYPVPDTLGLTCSAQGSPPDPVLFHDDITIPPGEQAEVSLFPPAFSYNIALSILDMTQDAGVECRFGSPQNTPVPIDARGFVHVLDWVVCSKLFLTNTTENTAIIGVTAIEVVS